MRLRVLLFHATRFACRPEAPASAAAEAASPREWGECMAVFAAAQAGDETRLASIADTLAAWAVDLGVGEVVLHSFAHLFCADPLNASAARQVLEELARELGWRGLRVGATPFGWRNAWELAVLGHPRAKAALEL
ncbi:MAG: hypothetical protein M0Z27_09980 [Thermaerobacter sp.]|nr:hypothetical protein [Thermaerobacter sp.]